MVKEREQEKQLIIFKKIVHTDDMETRVYKDIFKGRQILSIRRFYRDEETGEMCPGKGITLQEDYIDEIIEGLQIMLAWCEGEVDDNLVTVQDSE